MSVEEKLRAAIAALERAARDLQEIIDDDRGKIDPAFALDRVNAALARVRS